MVQWICFHWINPWLKGVGYPSKAQLLKRTGLSKMVGVCMMWLMDVVGVWMCMVS